MGSSMVVGKTGFPSDLPWVHMAAGRIFSVYFNSFQFYKKDKHDILCTEATSKVAHYKEANRNSRGCTVQRWLPPTQPLSAATCLRLPSPIATTCLIHSEVVSGSHSDSFFRTCSKPFASSECLPVRTVTTPLHKDQVPTSSQKLSWFLICLSSDTHSNGCIMTFPCTFEFISPRQVTLGSIFHIFISHLYTFG